MCFIKFSLSHCLTHSITHTHQHTHANLTPQRHEDGKEDGSRVVEQVWGSGGAAGGAEAPVVAGSVTQRTHGEIQTVIAHFLTERWRKGRGVGGWGRKKPRLKTPNKKSKKRLKLVELTGLTWIQPLDQNGRAVQNCHFWQILSKMGSEGVSDRLRSLLTFREPRFGTNSWPNAPGDVCIHGRHAVSKHDDSHNGGRYQQLSVNTQPSEVQADLLAKVLPVRWQGQMGELSNARDKEPEPPTPTSPPTPTAFKTKDLWQQAQVWNNFYRIESEREIFSCLRIWLDKFRIGPLPADRSRVGKTRRLVKHSCWLQSGWMMEGTSTSAR